MPHDNHPVGFFSSVLGSGLRSSRRGNGNTDRRRTWQKLHSVPSAVVTRRIRWMTCCVVMFFRNWTFFGIDCACGLAAPDCGC